MAKRILLFSAAALVLLWCLGLTLGDVAVRRASNEPWPLGLGTLEDVPKRLPPPVTTDAAEALADAASTFGVSLQDRYAPVLRLRRALAAYIDPTLAHPEKAVDPPPPDVAAFLETQGKQLDDIRRNLNANGDSIVWEKIPNLLGLSVLTRALAADALVRQRAGDAGAWDDVHAMLNLTRALSRRPEMVSSLIALSMGRMTNNVARRLSPPRPEWTREIAALDLRRSFIAAEQAEAWRMKTRDGDSIDLASPYTRFCLANAIQLHRAAAIDLAAGRPAVAKPPRWNTLARGSVLDFRSVSMRLNRFDQERK